MAEDKKSRACHYLQPQEWWFADATPIESVFLMMYGSRRPYAIDATRLHQTHITQVLRRDHEVEVRGLDALF
jgi:hypothetical protein